MSIWYLCTFLFIIFWLTQLKDWTTSTTKVKVHKLSCAAHNKHADFYPSKLMLNLQKGANRAPQGALREPKGNPREPKGIQKGDRHWKQNEHRNCFQCRSPYWHHFDTIFTPFREQASAVVGLQIHKISSFLCIPGSAADYEDYHAEYHVRH